MVLEEAAHTRIAQQTGMALDQMATAVIVGLQELETWRRIRDGDIPANVHDTTQVAGHVQHNLSNICPIGEYSSGDPDTGIWMIVTGTALRQCVIVMERRPQRPRLEIHA